MWKYTWTADQVRSLKRSDKQDGLFLGKFLAKVPGTYKMEVKIIGQRLAKSPFSFLLKVRELNIIGELDFPWEMRPCPAGIAVNNKVLLLWLIWMVTVSRYLMKQESLCENLVVLDTWMDSLTNQSTSHSSTMTRFWWQMNVITEYNS